MKKIRSESIKNQYCQFLILFITFILLLVGGVGAGRASNGDTTILYLVTSQSSTSYFAEYGISVEQGTQTMIRLIPDAGSAEVVDTNYSPSYAKSTIRPYTVMVDFLSSKAGVRVNIPATTTSLNSIPLQTTTSSVSELMIPLERIVTLLLITIIIIEKAEPMTSFMATGVAISNTCNLEMELLEQEICYSIIMILKTAKEIFRLSTASFTMHIRTIINWRSIAGI